MKYNSENWGKTSSFLELLVLCEYDGNSNGSIYQIVGNKIDVQASKEPYIQKWYGGKSLAFKERCVELKRLNCRWPSLTIDCRDSGCGN